MIYADEIHQLQLKRQIRSIWLLNEADITMHFTISTTLHGGLSDNLCRKRQSLELDAAVLNILIHALSTDSDSDLCLFTITATTKHAQSCVSVC